MIVRKGCLGLTAIIALAALAFGLDTDHDGLSDEEETHLHLTNPADADTDHDGVGDLAELHAGTDPRDPNSRFRFESIRPITLPGGEEGMEVSFLSVEGRRYALYYAEDLTEASWTPLLVDIPGTGELITLLDEDPGRRKGSTGSERSPGRAGS